MAVDPDVHSGLGFELAIQQEDTWGTAEATAGSFIKLHLTEQPTVDRSGLIFDETVRARGARVPHQEDYFFQKAGGVVRLAFNNVIVTETYLDYLIYLVMQDLVSEGVSTPYVKTYHWDESTTFVDFSTITAITDPGIIATVLHKNAISGEDDILTSCILESLTLASDPGAFGGRLTASGVFFSGHGADYDETGTQALTGATEPGTQYLSHFGGAGAADTAFCLNAKSLGGNDLIIGPWSITLNNFARRVGDTGGNAENYAIGSPMFSVEGSIDVKYDDNTKALLTSWLTSKIALPLVLQYGEKAMPTTTDGSFSIAAEVIPTGHDRDYGNEMGVFVSVPFKGFVDGTNPLVAMSTAFDTPGDRTWV